MTEAKKCGNDTRDFKTHKVYRCQEKEGITHAGVVCHQGNVWWPNGRPNINPNYRRRKQTFAEFAARAVAA